MEAFGRALLVEPYFTTVVLGGKILEATGREALIPSIAEGELLIALAHTEPESGFDLTAVETRAEPSGSGFRLQGRKSFVLHAATADKLIVSARTGDEGVSLFLVDRESEGVYLRAYATVDGLRAADIALEDVHVEEDALLGKRGGALAALEPVIDRAITLLAAEAVGAMGALNEATFDYLKTRRQFGVPMETFKRCSIALWICSWITSYHGPSPTAPRPRSRNSRVLSAPERRPLPKCRSAVPANGSAKKPSSFMARWA